MFKRTQKPKKRIGILPWCFVICSAAFSAWYLVQYHALPALDNASLNYLAWRGVEIQHISEADRQDLDQLAADALRYGR